MYSSRPGRLQVPQPRGPSESSCSEQILVTRCLCSADPPASVLADALACCVALAVPRLQALVVLSCLTWSRNVAKCEPVLSPRAMCEHAVDSVTCVNQGREGGSLSSVFLSQEREGTHLVSILLLCIWPCSLRAHSCWCN